MDVQVDEANSTGSAASGDDSSVIITSSTASERHSQRVTTEPSLAIALFGLQASLDRLIDVVAEAVKSMNQCQTAPQDPAVTRMAQALKLLQERDDGLSVEEQINMIALFVKIPAAVDAYLAIEEDGLRQAWTENMLLDANALLNIA
jgi:hypothetical protein